MASIQRLLLVSALAACVPAESAPTDHTVTLRLIAPPIAETDQPPLYELLVDGGSIGPVLDGVLDADTGTVAWVDPAGTLWAAPAADVDEARWRIADRVLSGLAVSRGRLGFAVRVDGPETAPMLADLRAGSLVALDDGPGPDEVMGFSPDGGELLLLSGRTGLTSLFAVAVGGGRVRQLTNVGLTAGPGLDPRAVTAAPATRRDVVWDRQGIRYRAGDGTVVLSATEVAR